MSILLALLSALCWSLYDLKRKQLAHAVSPLWLGFLLGILALPLYLLANIVSASGMPQADYWLPATASLGLSTLAAVLFLSALQRGNISELVPLLSVSPVVAAVLSWYWLDQGLSPLQWLAGGMVIGLLMMFQGGIRARWSLANYQMLTVAFCWGAGTVFDRQALIHSSPALHGLIQTAGMVLALGVIVLLRRQPRPKKQRLLLPLSQAAVVFFAAVLLQFWALQDVHPGVVELVKRSVGILGAVVWGYWLFSERLRREQWLLLPLIIAAIAGVLIQG